MRKMQSLLMAAIMVAALAFTASDASAGFKLKWDDDTYLDLGGRLQIFAVSANDTSLDGDSSNFENRTDFQIRRARFRLGAQANSFMGFFLQTDVSGRDMKMIDAYIKIKASKALQLGAGLIMSPSLRQNITSSGTLMTIARPSLTRKSLPWGLKNGTTFNTKSFKDSGATGAGKVGLGVRDAGLTLWGVIDTSDTVHMKYYLGLYNGAQSGIKGAGRNDNFHYTARYQVSFGDSESKYFHASTYFGKKDVITIGAAYDWQDDLVKDRANKIDYKLYTIDFFMEKMGMTVEAAYINMDLGENVSDTNLSKSAGDGYYVQAGYMVSPNIQPWAEYETWSSNAASGYGGHKTWRIGATYIVEKGHRANIKLGYENFTSDENIGKSNEDTIGTLLLGFFSTF
ncbi:MAG TPA: hypothetical protein ENI77_08820 [Nitrospirae bacterium]|nr:hypothetical protein [Nitrospirota bacterium]